MGMRSLADPLFQHYFQTVVASSLKLMKFVFDSFDFMATSTSYSTQSDSNVVQREESS